MKSGVTDFLGLTAGTNGAATGTTACRAAYRRADAGDEIGQAGSGQSGSSRVSGHDVSGQFEKVDVFTGAVVVVGQSISPSKANDLKIGFDFTKGSCAIKNATASLGVRGTNCVIVARKFLVGKSAQRNDLVWRRTLF